MKIHDPRTGQEPKVAYSVKSQVGSPSTLLNASGATNFLFEVVDIPQGTDFEEINRLEGSRSRIAKLVTAKMGLRYLGMQNEVFERNLQHIDTAFPEVMSVLLLKHYSSDLSSLVDVLDSFGDTIELPSSGRRIEKSLVKYQLKRFLVAVALGMTPSHAWSGALSATGGYLILKSDGELVCYHIFNINSFEDYLLRSTKFERGSESRHQYGSVYKTEGSRMCIKLNLQIRFTK